MHIKVKERLSIEYEERYGVGWGERAERQATAGKYEASSISRLDPRLQCLSMQL